MRISEKQVMDAIASVLMENRKVLRIGSSAPSAQPAPDMSMPPMQDPSMEMGAMGPTGGPGDAGMMGQNMGGDSNAMGGDPNDGMDNQFDSNFDAGVEADEESDPKHYIQQLTGKLSQSINSFNSEQGPDAGLCKYVASMIITATCKNLDEKAKKELIEKINTAASDEEPENGDENMDMGSGSGDEMPEDPEMGQGQQPMNEDILTKRQLIELTNAMGFDKRQDNLTPAKPKKNTNSIFAGKRFTK